VPLPDPVPGLRVEQEEGVLTVVFDRPQQHNAMTYAMYDGLAAACEHADADDDVRVLVLRGAGERAFVSGTDITQFQEVTTGEDGLAYEAHMVRVLHRLEDVTVPSVAVLRGWCVGGGLAIATVCDLRVAARSARFAVPIARTLGNGLSVPIVSMLAAQLGPARTLDLLLRARVLGAEDMAAAGYLAELVDDDALDATVDDVVATLRRHAPLTMWAAKQAVARLRRAALPDGDDLVRRVYGSEDFHGAVRAFAAKEPAVWRGR
jgi:enoyl-CoA hydratase/carnithine racemase